MEDMKFAKNLVMLRKEQGLTQGQLAEALNYSDKTISKWENGDALADVATLNAICQFFNVTMDDLYNGDIERDRKTKALVVKKDKWNKLVITLLAACFVWFVAVFAYVCVKIFADQSLWILFVYAVPLTVIVLLVFNSIWGNTRRNYLIISFLIWTGLATLHIQYMQFGNVWPIYFLGIPMQAVTILWSQLKNKTFRKNVKKGK